MPSERNKIVKIKREIKKEKIQRRNEGTGEENKRTHKK